MSSPPSRPSPADAPPAGTSFDPVAFMKVMPTLGHSGWLGMQYRAHGKGWAEIELPWSERLVGDLSSGILASGPIISLMDNATSISVWTIADQLVPHATLDLRIDYMRAARPGQTVVGRGECYKLTRTIAFVKGMAHDGDPDDPVAHAVGTFMATKGTYK